LETRPVGDALDDLSDMLTRAGYNMDIDASMRSVLEKNGFDGYFYTGKKMSGEAGYNGLHVIDSAASKMTKLGEKASPVPNEGDLLKWNFRQQNLLKQYGDWVSKTAKSISKSLNDPIEKNPTPDYKPTNNAALDAIKSDANRATSLDEIEAQLNERIAAAGDTVDPRDLETLKAIQLVKNSKDMKAEAEVQSRKIEDYIKCKGG
jgi:hypothetical protein